MPYFELEVGQRLLEWLPNLRYDGTLDAFVSTAYDEGGDDEVFKGTTTCIDGSLVTLYPIGAGSWTWDLADGEPVHPAI